MNSLTSTFQGDAPIQGNSLFSEGVALSSARRNVALLLPGVVTVWALALWSKLFLPHHDATTEVANFSSVLLETFSLNRYDTAVILRR